MRLRETKTDSILKKMNSIIDIDPHLSLLRDYHDNSVLLINLDTVSE